MLADHWAKRASAVYGCGHPDQPDAAHGVQAGVAPDRRPDDIGVYVDGPDALSAGSQHGQPPGGDVAGDPAGACAARTVACIDRQHRLTGLRAGQWLEAKHGAKSRRTWRKLHLAVDATSGLIVAQTLTDQDTDDPSQVGPLLDQIDEPIVQVTADGAYDGAPTYQTIAAHGGDIAVVIPPRATAIPSGELGKPKQRDRHLAMIAKQGRLAWQASTGYGQRS